MRKLVFVMKKICINDREFLEYRETPWDANVFGLNTNEIIEIKCECEESAIILLDLYDAYCSKHCIDFVYIRINSKEIILKKNLQDNGFYFAEVSHRLYMNVPENHDFNCILKSDLPVTIAEESDIEQIRNIARRNFHYGRFVEDAHLPQNASRERFSSWVHDLSVGDAEILVFRKGGHVRSFMIYRREGRAVELLLGGSDENLGYLTPLFWSSIFSYLQNQGVNQFRTTISAANAVILNIYTFFGFKVCKTLLGFHKFCPDNNLV